jgi:glycosyltransferase involved in cell wall biosynthesis
MGLRLSSRPVEISIVIPTRDRPEALRRCLGAIASDDLEIVVVDDGSRDRGAVAAAVQEAGGRLVRTPGAGPAAARNVGARAAGGEVICFTDDDCEPAAGWVTALAGPAAAHGAAAGRTIAPRGARAAVVASQAIVEHLTLSSLDPASGRLGFAPTCNLAVARDALGRLPFDESFPLAAGEDRDWSDRAAAAGLGPVYAPDAVVVHRQALTPSGFLRQQVAYGRGAARYRAAGAGRRLGKPGFYGGLVRRGFDDGAEVGGLVVAAQFATAAGVAVERLSRLGGDGGRRGGVGNG